MNKYHGWNMATAIKFDSELGIRLTEASKIAKWKLDSDGYLYTEASGLKLVEFRIALNPLLTAKQYVAFYNKPFLANDEEFIKLFKN